MTVRRPFIASTRCLRGWPVTYLTYRQETEHPFRRCDRARVLRVLWWGLVVGRWDSRAVNETAALTAALGARQTELLGADGTLLPRYRRKDPHGAA